ncbi:hypothetical protein IAI10_13250 [Clostridium sp. 19966]|uniref:hypothetical protein n=1 Tax=Clostridium sp. 19966 TaxID=2768166 RepID=UPI0028E0405E|nr:hypothetical protein [Clostridium sp. 19966]MDT8717633.1 hypothetical protein [Clostridium sp. 19966]
MDKLNNLFKIAEDNEIAIEYVKLQKNIYGIYYKEPDLIPAIGINKKIMNDKKLLTCVLAEELGHHFTTIGDLTAEYYCYNDRVLIDKAELLALKWAAHALLTPAEIVHAFHNNNNTAECADVLGITEDFLKRSIEIFKNENLFDSKNTDINIFF